MPAKQYYLPARRLVSQDDAAIIQSPTVPRSKFSGRFGRLTTFNAGQLIPFLHIEVYPGDHMRFNVVAMVRMATPIFPVMDSQRVDTHFFFVPWRLTWDNFVKMMGEQASPADSIAFTIPISTSPVGGYGVGSLQDHFALPTVGQITAGQTFTHSSLPLRAYNQIFNQWFRDENVVLPSADLRGNGPDNPVDFVIRYRAKSHDYFTSALPAPQKFTAPTVPLGGLAPITGIGLNIPAGAAVGPLTGTIQETNAGALTYTWARSTATDPDLYVKMKDANSAQPDIYADLSFATGVTINTLRQAFLIQQMLEKDARGGSRYVESNRVHFGVTSPDSRLQRPEYIGGGQTPLSITPVAQTAPSVGRNVGDLGGAGTAAGQHTASYAAVEHGIIIGLISVKSELHYQQGLHKMWRRSTRYDFYVPSLAQLGEQAILREEIYCNGVDAEDALVFGYQERWHELRTNYSTITGLFRSTSIGTIDQWHFAQRFNPAPTLNETFLADVPPMDRVLAAGAAANNQQYLADIDIHATMVRPLPTYGTPVTLGRF